MLLDIRQGEGNSDSCQMQEKVDYLSARRRITYQQWKTGILLRIQELEQHEEMEEEAG